jgi:hypothetical protein
MSLTKDNWIEHWRQARSAAQSAFTELSPYFFTVSPLNAGNYSQTGAMSVVKQMSVGAENKQPTFDYWLGWTIEV